METKFHRNPCTVCWAVWVGSWNLFPLKQSPGVADPSRLAERLKRQFPCQAFSLALQSSLEKSWSNCLQLGRYNYEIKCMKIERHEKDNVISVFIHLVNTCASVSYPSIFLLSLMVCVQFFQQLKKPVHRKVTSSLRISSLKLFSVLGEILLVS